MDTNLSDKNQILWRMW